MRFPSDPRLTLDAFATPAPTPPPADTRTAASASATADPQGPDAGEADPRAWDARRIRRRLLSVDNRRRIVRLVEEHPGIHLRQVARDLGLALGTVEHHLHLLVRHGLLERHGFRGHSRYFAAGTTDAGERRMWALLNQEGPRRLLRALAADPDAGSTGLAQRIGLSRTATARHLQQLIESGLVDRLRVGRHHLLRIARPDQVADALRSIDEGLPAHAWPGPPLEPTRPRRMPVRHPSRDCTPDPTPPSEPTPDLVPPAVIERSSKP